MSAAQVVKLSSAKTLAGPGSRSASAGQRLPEPLDEGRQDRHRRHERDDPRHQQGPSSTGRLNPALRTTGGPHLGLPVDSASAHGPRHTVRCGPERRSRINELTATEGAVLGSRQEASEPATTCPTLRGHDRARRGAGQEPALCGSAPAPARGAGAVARGRASEAEPAADRNTKGGERALKGWLQAVEPGDRDGFYLKTFLGG